MKRIAAVLAVLSAVSACSNRGALPAPGSTTYQEFCSAFYTGLAGLQSGEDVRAHDDLLAATKIVPEEPAGWADLAVFQLRRQDFESAQKNALAAQQLTPQNSRIEELLGQIESKRGNVALAIDHFKKAADLDQQNQKAIYALALEKERQGQDADAMQALQKLSRISPENVAVLLEEARLSAKLGHSEQVKVCLAALQQQSNAWPAPAQQQLAAIQTALAGPNVQAAAVPIQFLRNVLLRTESYQRGMDEVRTPTTLVFEPFTRLLKLTNPRSEPDQPDMQLQFAKQSALATTPAWVGTVSLDDQTPPALMWVDGDILHVNNAALHIRSPGGTLPKHAIAAADLNYDFKTDLIAATRTGLTIYRQQDPQHFTDVTGESKLDAKTIHGNYNGAWAFDFDLDGDLDIVLGVPSGEPVVLRNNGDGTFAVVHPFASIDGLFDFAAADVDGDGVLDVAAIDKSAQLTLFRNRRLGHFEKESISPALASGIQAVAAGDLSGNGYLQFIVLRSNGSIASLAIDQKSLAANELVGPQNHPAKSFAIADLDNNGALDLIAGNTIFLNDGKHLTPLAARLPSEAVSAADFNNDGRLDLVDESGATLINHAQKNYRWQNIRTRAAQASGDQRINSFGIGGELELRADLLTEKQIIAAPLTHFGLGNHKAANFARITWPNGSIQAEFALTANQTVLAQQRLKGSCPFLFTWNGTHMQFVKDTAPWSPALGLPINGQKVAGIYQTQEWFKIPGDQLVAHNGFYDLRVTAEYWETFYIDHYSLMVVDHPKGTEIYTDERFAVPPPPLRIYATDKPSPFLHATGSHGQDVSAVVGNLDESYLDDFARGRYQGVAADHWVELELPGSAVSSKPLYLIAQGWMHPSDATTNVALGQSSGPQPSVLSVETPDGHGGWTIAKAGLGFPAGRKKTIVLELSSILPPGERKFRLRTNLEIYWDRLAWAHGVTMDEIKVNHLPLQQADLSFRGFSEMKQANQSSPETPVYENPAANGQRWRDMQGYFTRYGDVKPLLEKIDDRMVIVDAGDELRLKYPEQPAPLAGWTRDYIMVGDGWIKDGDYNTTFSSTVLPLPYHGMKNYSQSPGPLEEDPAYRLHPADWASFHTRYVTPELFNRALWANRGR